MRRRPAVTAVVTALLAAGLISGPAAAPAAAGTDRPRYTNPVSDTFADTFADPVIVRGDDGAWYAYGTTDPLREGEGVFHRIPTARSTDLVTWTYVGDAFAPGQRPAFAADDAAFWAPDVRRLNGRWVMYVTVTETTVAEGASAIGVATAPTPTGPWTFADEPVVAPRPAPGGGWLWTFDPAQLTTPDGRRFLYYGSYFGGIWVSELTADGLRITGTPRQVAIDNKFEGAYVVRRGGWYYLFASSANCCAGPTTGYSVSAGRSRDPRGPFTDRDGLRLDVSRAGGTPVIAPNGNRWVGTGHNGLVTDLAGQDWLPYHAIDRADPYLDGTEGVNERPMLLDRLDWIGGWPTVRAGAWASDRPVAAPVTRGHRRVRGDVRAEADVRGAGLTVDTVTVRAHAGRLTATRGRRVLAAADLPPGFAADAWHRLVVQVEGDRLTALLDDATELTARVPRGPGIVRIARPGAARHLSVAPVAEPVRRAVPAPRAGAPLRAYSDEFGGGLTGWTFVRPDPAATVAGGELRWPVQGADLAGPGGTAGVLLRAAPRGDWIAETRVDLDLGEDTVRNYQQAGLIAYVGDDQFARLSAVAIWNTRQVEFGLEIPYAGRLSYGGTIAGTPGRVTTWLRLAHRVDEANGEHEYRAGVSRDGRTWTWGGVWTLPADTTPRIGLVAHGALADQAPPAVTASFDYLRFFRRR
jgi:hypothetical protein